MIFHANGIKRKLGQLYKVDFKTKTNVKKRQRRMYITLKRSIQEEDITILTACIIHPTQDHPGI